MINRILILALLISSPLMRQVQAQELYPKLFVNAFSPDFEKSQRNGLFHDSFQLEIEEGRDLFVKAGDLIVKEFVTVEIEDSDGDIRVVKNLTERADTFIFKPTQSGKFKIHVSTANKKTVCHLHLVTFPPTLPAGFEQLTTNQRLISIGRMAIIHFLPIRATPWKYEFVYNLKREKSEQSPIVLVDELGTRGVIRNDASVCTYTVTSDILKDAQMNKLLAGFRENLISDIKKYEGVEEVYCGLSENYSVKELIQFAPYEPMPLHIFVKTSQFAHYLIETGVDRFETSQLTLTLSQLNAIEMPIIK